MSRISSTTGGAFYEIHADSELRPALDAAYADEKAIESLPLPAPIIVKNGVQQIDVPVRPATDAVRIEVHSPVATVAKVESAQGRTVFESGKSGPVIRYRDQNLEVLTVPRTEI